MSEDRKKVLLRAAYDLLTRIERSNHSDALAEMVFYDDTNCDGECLRQEIAQELELEDGEDEQPLQLAEPDEFIHVVDCNQKREI